VPNMYARTARTCCVWNVDSRMGQGVFALIF
jgi:hypothetical protein